MEESNIIELGIQSLTVIEDMGMAIIPVTRTGDTSQAASVEYSTWFKSGLQNKKH